MAMGKLVRVVVEPDVLSRTVIADYLRSCGCRVLESVSAEDVLAILAGGERVDIIFSEVRLAGERDGFSLAKYIRDKHPVIDVLLTSGIANAADKAGEQCED
jgi:CheY-like chemotaxis protein